ncbi:unnamed protein product [Ambrosiozyma monospora]|uniref:Unnamed protein product n=1 Tax=Ambrosiozyma monospora TaxID=43982 RepID=A0ACB5T7J9_AMBMO|nr:unnamed protein product [Ambrosiozyma monospora]
MIFKTDQIHKFLSSVTFLSLYCSGIPLKEPPTTIESKSCEKLSEDGPTVIRLVKREVSTGGVVGIVIALVIVTMALGVATILLKEKWVKRRIAKGKPVPEDSGTIDISMMLNDN